MVMIDADRLDEASWALKRLSLVSDVLAAMTEDGRAVSVDSLDAMSNLVSECRATLAEVWQLCAAELRDGKAE